MAETNRAVLERALEASQSKTFKKVEDNNIEMMKALATLAVAEAVHRVADALEKR